MTTEQIPMGRMFIDDEMRSSTLRILNSGYWIKGPESKAFGLEWAEYCGALGGVPCSNGSVALIAALHTLGIGPGDEVIVPSHTYIASATCISMVGATPIFVEIEEEFYTLDIESVKQALTPRTKCIIAVHLYGQPIDSEIFTLAEDAGIFVIEDAAQAHGASLNGKQIGSFGDIATFSFFPSKNMAVGGDGGAILANTPDLVQKISTFIDHGRSDKYRNDVLGTNFRLSEIQCGIGRIQLKHLAGWVSRRNEIAELYLNAFVDLDKIIIPKIRKGAIHAWHQFVLRVKERDKFIQHLKNHQISTGIHYPIPCHLQPIYSNHPQGKIGELPFTERLCEEIVSIPVFPLLNDEEVERVITAVSSF
jgi:perosamine synthetase